MLVLWVAILVLLFAGVGLFSAGTNNTFAIPGTESQNALDALARTFPEVSGTSAQMIVVAAKGGDVRQPEYQSPIEASVAKIAKIPQVQGASSPYASTPSTNISSDATAALVPVQLSVGQSAVKDTTKAELQAAGVSLSKALPHGAQVAVGGQLFSQTSSGISITEFIGVLIAFIVLIFTFGSFVAAGLPLITALLGVAASLSVILIATRFISITSTTPLLALMLGLAVGIDYALFIISRHQDQLKQGIPPEESAARAVATAGSAVVFAAVTVIIALLGLSVAGIPFLTTMGVAAAFAVAVAVLISMTLTPALLGFAGMRLVPKRYRLPLASELPDASTVTDPDAVPDDLVADAAPADAAPADAAPSATTRADAATGDESVPSASDLPQAPRGFFLGWVRAVTKWPIVTVLAVVFVLGLATVPAASLRLALPDAGSLEPGDPARITYDLIGEHFGPGYNGPLLVTGSIIQSSDPVGVMKDLGTEIAAVPGVASVPLSTPNQAGDTGIVQVIPEGSPDSAKTKALVATLRSLHDTFQKEHGVDLSVTGYTAAGIDISARLGQALLPFALLVVGLSLILLAMVFRSIVVPVTAALGYLLSIGTAFGVSSLVFESGFLAGPLGVHALGSVISFMPIILMGVLFGLAMDYEVFLVSRMREDYVHHHDARGAVERGFVGSARVVTAAAIIMFAVFAAFIPEGDASIQPIAVGLAVGVTVDAFIVRMTLIPAVLVLFGDHAWWMPAWLDRALPSFDVEGEGLHKELEVDGWPDPALGAGVAIAIAAEHVTISNAARVVVADLSMMVPAGSIAIVRGGAESGKTSLLLTLAGRLSRVDGRLKVAGVALPMRASTVRRRVGIARLGLAPDPVSEVWAAVSQSAEIIMIDDLDAVTHPRQRAEIARVLNDALG
ncbi:MAG: MMPL family transporter, partial [Microbacteriaceae bacterium]